MSKEIERRWLLTSVEPEVLGWPYKHIEQGYVSTEPGAMRSRVVDGKTGYFCYKDGEGMQREEDEKPVTDVEDAKFVLKGCKYRVRKYRHQKPNDPWEVDACQDELASVFLAEIEHPDAASYSLPLEIGTGIEVTDSISNSHLARLAYDLRTRKVEGSIRDLLLAPQRLPRIVLTGGPCSGKSEVMENLKAEFGGMVHFMPEMATMIITHGVRPSTDPVFQSFIYRVQRDFETITDMQARAAGKGMLITDRGSVDNAAYLPGGIDQFERVCRTKRKAEFALYDVVLCLEVAPQEVYEEKKRNNPARTETYDEAIVLSKLIECAWREHPGFRLISNDFGWKGKLDTVRHIVRRHLARSS